MYGMHSSFCVPFLIRAVEYRINKEIHSSEGIPLTPSLVEGGVEIRGEGRGSEAGMLSDPYVIEEAHVESLF